MLSKGYPVDLRLIPSIIGGDKEKRHGVVLAKSIEEGFIHATVGTTTPDEECDLDYCINGSIEQEVNAAISNSLGFGGHNATVCFKKVRD